MATYCFKTKSLKDPRTVAICVSYPWFCLVISLSLLCTVSLKCPDGCALLDCKSSVMTDDFDPKVDHGKHVHHNVVMSCTCDGGDCENKEVPTSSGAAQIVFGVLFALMCIIGFYLNSCVLDFGLFEFEGGFVNCKTSVVCDGFDHLSADFLRTYQSNGTSWKYLIRITVLCLAVGFAMSFVTPFSVVLINIGLIMLLFIIYIHLKSKSDSTRQDDDLVQQLYWLLPLRPRANQS